MASREVGQKLSIYESKQKLSSSKKSITEHFGNKYNISCTYVEKALSWHTLKSEVSQILQDFALFLRSCCNAMKGMEYIEELNTISNLRSTATKQRACEIQEQSGKVKMNDLLCFIENQVKMLSDPMFGNI
ncbi:MAG: hypothetical protein ACRCW5_05950 [Cetobacterium sp.]|uniref:hypothetical protein n=1 Tax=Cetobacterium sp. TaxID=2071632 RepID=UPI003F401524